MSIPDALSLTRPYSALIWTWTVYRKTPYFVEYRTSVSLDTESQLFFAVYVTSAIGGLKLAFIPPMPARNEEHLSLHSFLEYDLLIFCRGIWQWHRFFYADKVPKIERLKDVRTFGWKCEHSVCTETFLMSTSRGPQFFGIKTTFST